MSSVDLRDASLEPAPDLVGRRIAVRTADGTYRGRLLEARPDREDILIVVASDAFGGGDTMSVPLSDVTVAEFPMDGANDKRALMILAIPLGTLVLLAGILSGWQFSR